MRKTHIQPGQQKTIAKRPDHVIEIFLQPGDFYFGDQNTRIRTLLGSCVSITMWHPLKQIGGMCHYMLPSRVGAPALTPDGRYAEEAMEMFLREIRAAKTHPSEYLVKIFGGGKMFPGEAGKCACNPEMIRKDLIRCKSVSCRNAGIAKSTVAKHGFMIEAEDLGGSGHRNVIFDVWSGHVWVRHVKTQQQNRSDF